MQFNPHKFIFRQMKYSHAYFILSRRMVTRPLALGLALVMVGLSAALIFGNSASAAQNSITSTLSTLLAATQNEQPSVGPGIPQVGSNAPKSALSSTKAGSVLFLPRYTSDNTNPGITNTII